MGSPTSAGNVVTKDGPEAFNSTLVQEMMRPTNPMEMEISPGRWEFWIENKQLKSRLVVNVGPESSGLFVDITVRTLVEHRDRYERLGGIRITGIKRIVYDIPGGHIDFLYEALDRHTRIVSISNTGSFSIC